MRYEVTHGQNTQFVQSGNPWSACLDTLRQEAEQDEVQAAPFRVTPLPLGSEEIIPMAEVLSIRVLACNPHVFRMDLSQW
jgi:hypothetical protein